MLTGFAGENRTWRPLAQRLMRTLLVIEGKPAADAPPCFRHRAIRLDEGEWRGALQPGALSEPDVNLPIHPAPIIQPLAPGSNERTGQGSAAEASVTTPTPPACDPGSACICETPIAR